MRGISISMAKPGSVSGLACGVGRAPEGERRAGKRAGTHSGSLYPAISLRRREGWGEEWRESDSPAPGEGMNR